MTQDSSAPNAAPPGVTIPTGTKLCIIVGDPVSHSLSPAMHNAAYEACGIGRTFHYIAAKVPRGELRRCVAQVRELGMRGLTCTIPHKSDILPFLDELDPAVAAIGAANTIVQGDGGRLTGYNTDWLGIVEPLSAVTSIKGKRAAVIGAGGTARAALYGLQQRGAAEILVFNRTMLRAVTLAKEFGAHGPVDAYPLDEAANKLSSCDIIVQTTSVGMVPHTERTPVPANAWREGQVVIEAIYKPLHTRLLQDAAAAGAQTIPGAAMFLAQGVAQFALYTGVDAPMDVMRGVICESLGVARF